MGRRNRLPKKYLRNATSWGEEYGHLGEHAFLNEFRSKVQEIVAAGRTYCRLFLLYDGPETAEKKLGLALKSVADMRALQRQILLLVSDDGTKPEVAHALPFEVWDY